MPGEGLKMRKRCAVQDLRPPGWKPGSLAARMAATTFFGRALASLRRHGASDSRALIQTWNTLSIASVPRPSNNRRMKAFNYPHRPFVLARIFQTRRPAGAQTANWRRRRAKHGVPASAGRMLAAAGGGPVPNHLPRRAPHRLKPGLHTRQPDSSAFASSMECEIFELVGGARGCIPSPAATIFRRRRTAVRFGGGPTAL